MRPAMVALAVGAALAVPARAGELRNFEDAALHAVQLVDGNEGWAVGDEGVVWHTIDGGRAWERQPTGVRTSLRALHFLNPYTGWVAGREELPHGAGSVGVLLYTQDGGMHWQCVGRNALPGLNAVRFVDQRTGYLAGDGTDRFPTGVFMTTDGGRSWRPLAGPRSPGWLAAGFADGRTGVLAGAWGSVATVHDGALGPSDLDPLGGRAVAGLVVAGKDAIAVGQGGLVLVSRETTGARWSYAELGLADEARAAWDFRGVCSVGEHLWAVGRPGSVVAHSADRGRSWEVLRTGQALPLDAVWFADARHGWAVGELGCVLATEDGGKTWRVQRQGGRRAAALFVHARPNGVPLDTVALLGGEDGYFVTGLAALAADPASASPARAGEPCRLAAAVRRAGGAAGEMLWQFPLPQHLGGAGQRELMATWDKMHGDRAAEQLVRQLVLALRTWRPGVVVTDPTDQATAGSAAGPLVAEAVQEAYRRAADPKAFPEQLQVLGLEPWQAAKVYARCDGGSAAQVVLDLNEPRARLAATARDFVAPAVALLSDSPASLPPQRCYRLLASTSAEAAAQSDLMAGTNLGTGSGARRPALLVAEPSAELLKAVRAGRNLQAMAAATGGLVEPARLVAQVGPQLDTLPDDQGATAALALASQYARLGQWVYAREVFELMARRYPTHPLTVEAYRWLVRHGASSEARYRYERSQYRVVQQADFRIAAGLPAKLPPGGLRQVAETTPRGVDQVRMKAVEVLDDPGETRKWYQHCVEAGDRLTALSPLVAGDPAIQFSVQAARRSLGRFDEARQWYARFCQEQAAGPWRDAAAAELWLTSRGGPAPKTALIGREVAVRPFLDGKLDDACWQGDKPAVLRDAVGATARAYPTEARVAFDGDFLYLAVRCRHPQDRYVPPVKVRTRDADLGAFDRVSLLLDLDRDYSTYYRLEIDQRGCLREDCWSDGSWDPRWFVAVRSDRDGWTAEAAIPISELSSEPPTPGQAWACNVVRVLPGRGVQAVATPADVEPRPEGMGLLLFTGSPAARKAPTPPGRP